LNVDEQYHEDLRSETECYNTLVNDGGRPSHPVSLLEDVLKNPGEYREILSYWQDHPAGWKVFSKQLQRWGDFRERQRSMREQGRFPEYIDVLRDRLTKHDFFVRTFQFHEDPSRQDKLTTWVEYLDFEYRTYNQFANYIRRHQRQYDEAWKKLVDSKVLRPFETEESVSNIESEFQRQRERSERIEAEEAVKSANSAVEWAQGDIRNPRLSQKARQELTAAKNELGEAIKLLESIDRRAELVSEFKQSTRQYRSARDKAERQSILLQWMLEQVALIELELNLPYNVRRRVRDAGAGKGARMGQNRLPGAGVSIALACGGRWRTLDAGVEKGARMGSPAPA
jgi:hypothetical protein